MSRVDGCSTAVRFWFDPVPNRGTQPGIRPVGIIATQWDAMLKATPRIRDRWSRKTLMADRAGGTRCRSQGDGEPGAQRRRGPTDPQPVLRRPIEFYYSVVVVSAVETVDSRCCGKPRQKKGCGWAVEKGLDDGAGLCTTGWAARAIHNRVPRMRAVSHRAPGFSTVTVENPGALWETAVWDREGIRIRSS